MAGIDEEALTVLACDLGARPSGAPGIDAVLPRVRAVSRERDALVVSFAPQYQGIVEAFAAAERMCCPEIGWTVESLPASALRIVADPQQLDLLQGMFSR